MAGYVLSGSNSGSDVVGEDGSSAVPQDGADFGCQVGDHHKDEEAKREVKLSDSGEEVANSSRCSSAGALESEDRPLSAMSGETSRIPSLIQNNFASLRAKRREKSNVYELARPLPEKLQGSNAITNDAFQRSRSFSTSRGMAGLVPLGGTTGVVGVPLTPEIRKRKITEFSFNYLSPYSQRAIAAERGHRTLSSDEDNDEDIRNSSAVITHSCCEHGEEEDVNHGVNRSLKNVLHCPHQYESEEYLTPTQRAARKIRELEAELKRARSEINDKDAKLSILTREFVDLKIDKAGYPKEESTDLKKEASKRQICSTVDGTNESFPNWCHSASSAERKSTVEHDPDSSRLALAEGVFAESDSEALNRSLADSGQYEDLPADSGHSSKESLERKQHEEGSCHSWEFNHKNLLAEFQRKVEEMKEHHMEEYQELKETCNDKVELLLSKLSDANLRYFEIRPLYDKSLEKISESDNANGKLKDELHQCQLKQQKVYLQMYLKGKQAAKFQAQEELLDEYTSIRHSSDPEVEERVAGIKTNDNDFNSVAVMTLMKQLAQAEEEIHRLQSLPTSEEVGQARRSSFFGRDKIDPDVKLQFLKSAIFYFLTDRDNSQGHLRAIESILDYSPSERSAIKKRFKN